MPMTLEDIRAERDQLVEEARGLLERANGGDLAGDDLDRFETIDSRLHELRVLDRDSVARTERIRERLRNGELTIEHTDGPSTAPGLQRGTQRRAESGVRGRALDVIEALQRADTPLTDGMLEAATRMVERDVSLAPWAAAAGDEHYRTAFWKMLGGGPHLLDEPERAAAQQAYQVQRAMALDPADAGGMLVPLTLDPNVLLSSDGVTDPMRQIARRVTISTTSWKPFTSAGVTSRWAAEATQAGDDSPTLDDAQIDTHKADSFVPFSLEVGQDVGSLETQLGRMMADAKITHEAAAFWPGTGNGQPQGLLTGLPAASKVATASVDVITEDDLTGLQSALPPRWQGRARFATNLAVRNAISSLTTPNGSLRFPSIADGRLLNRPLEEASEMASPGDTAGAGGDPVVAYGDFTNYVIVDRVGARIELVPHLFGTDGRPTGQRGLYCYWRVGGGITVANGFRVLTA